ncbi:MAG TPA: hypothetical protein VN915_02460 [Elusimicrobiota bacterium]|nr:hypothetical protein [Elusimicrobiota bacterium]
MRRSFIAGCALVLAATSAFARGGGGRGFSGGRGASVSGGRAASRGFSGVSRGFSGGFSHAAFRPSIGRSTSFTHSSFFRAAARPAASRSFGRATFHAAAARTTARRVTGSDSGGTPAWAAIGSKIVSEGQPPVYSQASGGGTHSVEGGGFIAMDQSKANDVGRAPGISWAPPDRAMSSGASGGGGTGASSNGPAFDPSF